MHTAMFIAAWLCAAVTAGGAIFSWLSAIEVQREANRNALLLRLIGDDPIKTTENLLYFSNAGLLELSPKTIEALKSNPYTAPIRPDEAPPAALEADPPVLATPDLDVSLNQLVSDLNSPNRTAHLEAARALTTRFTASPAAVDALIAELGPDRLVNLTPDGRLNVIAVLASLSAWSDPQRTQAQAALAALEARQQDGVVIGPRTAQQIERLRARIVAGS